jgi:hypothetical protein
LEKLLQQYRNDVISLLKTIIPLNQGFAEKYIFFEKGHDFHGKLDFFNFGKSKA